MTTGILQFVIYPYLGKVYDEAAYGEILFVVGIVNVIILTLGNSLGDIRVAADNSDADTVASFNPLMLIAVFLGSIFVTVFLIINGNMDFLSILLLVVFCALGTMNSYLTGIFRLRLDFKRYFILSTITSVGYLVGLVLFVVSKQWAAIFVAAYIGAVTYLIKNTKIFHDGFSINARTKTVTKEYAKLSVSYALKSSLTYIDRLIIYPMLGAGTVATYTVSTVLGKCVQLVLQPMGSVLLGYYAQPEFQMSRKRFWQSNILTLLFGFVAFVCTTLFSRLVIKLLYPGYVDAVKGVLIYANLATVIGALPSIIQSALLKFAKMEWQVVIQAIYGALSVLLAMILIPIYGLIGFCFALIIANITKLVMMMIIGDRSIRNKEAKNVE